MNSREETASALLMIVARLIAMNAARVAYTPDARAPIVVQLEGLFDALSVELDRQRHKAQLGEHAIVTFREAFAEMRDAGAIDQPGSTPGYEALSHIGRTLREELRRLYRIESESDDLRARVELMTEEIGKHRGGAAEELANYRFDAQLARRERDDARAQLAALQSEADAGADRAQRVVLQAEEEARNARAEVEKLRAENDYLMNEIKGSNADLDNLGAEYERRGELCEELGRQVRIAEEAAASNRRELDRQIAENEALREKLNARAATRGHSFAIEIDGQPLRAHEGGSITIDMRAARAADVGDIVAAQRAASLESLFDAQRVELVIEPAAQLDKEEGEGEGDADEEESEEWCCDACGLEPVEEEGAVCDDCLRERAEEEEESAAETLRAYESAPRNLASELEGLEPAASVNLAAMVAAQQRLASIGLNRLAWHARDTRWHLLSPASLLDSAAASLARVATLAARAEEEEGATMLVREEAARRAGDAANYIALALARLA